MNQYIQQIIRQILGENFSSSKKPGNLPWHPPVEASEFDIETINLVAPFTMTSPKRIWSLISATRYVIQNDIPGDFCECGVWRGGSVLAIARTLENLGVKNRKIYLYDTFRGMTAPTLKDITIGSGESAVQLLDKTPVGDGRNVWAFASLDEVERNLEISQYPKTNYIFVVGDILKTLTLKKPDEICLLRLDTDWYESTKIELEILYPLLQSGGVLIIDDYGHWAGSRNAVEEYFAAHPFKPLMQYVDYTGRLMVKVH